MKPTHDPICYTSNFASYKSLTPAGYSPVSICLRPPRWLSADVPRDMSLAPTAAILDGNDVSTFEGIERYTEQFVKAILDKFTLDELIAHVSGKVLLCFCARATQENNWRFCHRRLIVDWIEYHRGHHCPELGVASQWRHVGFNIKKR